MIEPKEFLIWTCSLIFAATGIITLIGLVKKDLIEKRFLNKLFTSLILEVVAISIFAFSENLKSDSSNQNRRVWLVTTPVRFLDKHGNRLPDQNSLAQKINV